MRVAKSPPPRRATGAAALIALFTGACDGGAPDRLPAAGPAPARSSAASTTSAKSAAAASAFPARLERSSVRLLPDPAKVVACYDGPIQWRTDEAMRAALADAIAVADLTGEQRRALTAALACPGGGGCAVTIPDEVALGLSARAREVLYPILARDRGNPQASPFRFRITPEADLRSRLPGVSEAAFRTLSRLTYPARGHLAFADLPALCRTLPREERTSIVRLLNGTPAVRAQVRVDPSTDVAALLRYFRTPEMRPVVEAAIARSGVVDLAEFLPRFARDRLERYPDADDRPGALHNCYWTAFNFEREAPRADLSDEKVVEAELAARYVEVAEGEEGFGDVLVVRREDGWLVHAAVHIAEDVYFTRNGFTVLRPWVLMRRADLDLRYPGRARHYRPRDRATRGPL